MHDDDTDLDMPTVSLTDEVGRDLPCYVERSFDIDGQTYLLLMPIHAPIEIFAWQDDETGEEEFLVDVEDDEIDKVFETAKAVLAEQDLRLYRTALTLTASGDLPEVDEDEIISLDVEGEDEGKEEADLEQFQQLTTFYYQDQEYIACTPLDPLLFFARLNEDGTPRLLSPTEFQQMRPQLEDQLFDVLDD